MSDEELVRRLRAVEEYGKYDLLTEGRPERLRNPDGPDAADAIERLTRECEKAFTAMRVFERYRELEAQIAATTTRAEAAERKVDKLREALEECLTSLSWVLLEGIDEVIPETCPVEYKRACDATDIAHVALAETEKGDE